jgi:hypothetical protein
VLGLWSGSILLLLFQTLLLFTGLSSEALVGRTSTVLSSEKEQKAIGLKEYPRDLVCFPRQNFTVGLHSLLRFAQKSKKASFFGNSTKISATICYCFLLFSDLFF